MNHNNLPPNWSWVKLGDASEPPQYGYTTSASNDGDLKFLRTTDITSGHIEWDSVPFCKVNPKEVDKYILKENDIVISRAGSVGYSLLLSKPHRAVFASYLIRFRPKTNAKFFALFLQSPDYWNQISEKKLGIAVPNVNATKLKDINFPLPPLPEQKKIVDKIEELFSGLDSGAASLKKAKEQIRLYRQSVLASAFSGRLNPATAGRHDSSDYKINRIKSQKKSSELMNPGNPEIQTNHGSDNLPDGWKWVKLGEVGQVVAGGTPSTKVKEYFDGNIAWITPADLTGYKIKYISHGRRNLTELGLKNSSARLVPKNSVLFSSRAPIGYVAIAANDISTNQGFKNLVPNEVVNCEYVYYYLKSAKQLAEKNASGTTFKEISAKNFANLPFPLAHKDQQTQIVSEIEKRFSEADNLEKAIDDSLEKSEALRQSILKQAFEGKLV